MSPEEEVKWFRNVIADELGYLAPPGDAVNPLREVLKELKLKADRFDLIDKHKGEFTLRQLQAQMPWTTHYHRDFRASPMAHKDFSHALLHVFKAAGKIAAVVNDAEHGGHDFNKDAVDRYVADLVVCALRMATTCPGRQIDLQKAVEARIENKNTVNLEK